MSPSHSPQRTEPTDLRHRKVSHHRSFQTAAWWGALVMVLSLLYSTQLWGQVLQTHQVAMPDGARLHTLVLLPGNGQGKWPVVLSRSPYPIGPNQGLLNFGIAVVEQNTRGRYQSTGEDTIFGDARADGAATIDWILKQPWCNGKIATFGASAVGLTQYLLADAVGPKIVAQMPLVGTTDLYHSVFFPGGVFRYELVYNWLENQATTNGITPPHPMLAEFEKNALSGTPFWQRRQIVDWPQVAAAGIHIGGWYDIFTQGTINAFVGYRDKAAPSARKAQILIMGAWAHDTAKAVVGELTFPNQSDTYAGLSLVQLYQGWVDRFLHEKPTSLLDGLAPVNVYVMGAIGEAQAPGNIWVKAKTWPPPGQEIKLYLRQAQKLDTNPPPLPETPESFLFDPANPVPTLGGPNLTIAPGPYDQRPVENRKDVLLYNSIKLPDPIPLIGQIKATLWVSTDAKDTDFTVKLTDVYPDGRSMLLRDGIVRLRHRNTTTREEFVTPNTPVEVSVDLGSTAIVLNRGHQLRVAISSSNAPRFAPNPNTGAPFAVKPAAMVKANNTVYHAPGRASYISLPIADVNQWLGLDGGTTEATPEPTTEPVVDSVTEPVAEPAQEPVQEPGSEHLLPDAHEANPDIPDATLTTEQGSEKPAAPQNPPDTASPEVQPTKGCGCQQTPLPTWCFLGIVLLSVLLRKPTTA